MRKILVFGNSGSGKSTLAGELKDAYSLAHLDLDSLAWLHTNPPQREPLETSRAAIERFTRDHQAWVIEGCYADLLAYAAAEANEVLFLNLPISLCQENAKQREWEPHKYPDKAAQDANLDMLLAWIADYENREDETSKTAHLDLYESFAGEKTMYTSNSRPTPR